MDGHIDETHSTVDSKKRALSDEHVTPHRALALVLHPLECLHLHTCRVTSHDAELVVCVFYGSAFVDQALSTACAEAAARRERCAGGGKNRIASEVGMARHG